MKKQLNKGFEEWKKNIIYLRDKVILPDNSTVDKGRWIGKDGFKFEEFDEFLYNNKYRKDERE